MGLEFGGEAAKEGEVRKVTEKKHRYNFGELKLYNPVKAGYRIDQSDDMRWVPKRFETGLSSFDKILGGLPFGLTIITGAPGTGKSLLAKVISRACNLRVKSLNKVIYACCESMSDYPKADGIHLMNFTKFLPNWRQAIDELFGTIIDYDADMAVIDSVTTFLSSTNKAVEEADVRPGVFDIAKRCERQIPVIAISQMRGSGNYMYPAGGQAIPHAGSLLIDMERIKIKDHWIAERYGEKEGSIIWTLEVVKDKEGVAEQHKEFKVVYEKGFTSLRLDEIKGAKK